MDIFQAREINANARTGGTTRFTAEQRAEFEQARAVMHAHEMETSEAYRRGFRQAYNHLAAGAGRIDLVGSR